MPSLLFGLPSPPDALALQGDPQDPALLTDALVILEDWSQGTVDHDNLGTGHLFATHGAALRARTFASNAFTEIHRQYEEEREIVVAEGNTSSFTTGTGEEPSPIAGLCLRFHARHAIESALVVANVNYQTAERQKINWQGWWNDTSAHRVDTANYHDPLAAGKEATQSCCFTWSTGLGGSSPGNVITTLGAGWHEIRHEAAIYTTSLSGPQLLIESAELTVFVTYR